MRAAALTLVLASAVLASAPPASAQVSTPVPSDTANALPIQPVRTLSFTTDEGTWISLDVSPDGGTIVFDLLGDLYTIPIEGGAATRLTSGTPWDGMPRWSPDGTTIAFISDRDGTDNLWLVAPDGSSLRKLTQEVDNTLSSPAWSPDSQYLVVRRFGPYPSAENYLTNVPLWMVHVAGGTGVQVYPTDSGAKSTNTGAAFAPDGRTLFVSTHGGGYTGENLGAYQVRALDLESGTERTLTAGAGGALRPTTSPDGRWLVYVTRVGARTALRIRDLQTHEDDWLVADVQRDDQEGYAPNDVFPGYAFTPDSRAVVFTSGGKIRRVEVEGRVVTEIPFSVDVELGMGARLSFPERVDDGPLQVTQLIAPVASPAGNHLAFSGVGTLWTAELSGSQVSQPQRLLDADQRAYFPAFSPDGEWLAYVTWVDSIGGHVWKTRADGSDQPQRLTEHPGYVRWPQWAPAGDRIVYSWAPRRVGLGAGPVASLGELRWVPAGGGASSTIVPSESAVSLVTAGDEHDARVYFTENVPNATPGFNATQTTAVVSTRFDGSEKRTHAKITSAQAGSVMVQVSPEGSAMIVLERDNLFVVPLTPAGPDGLAINLASPSVPLRRLTSEGANYAHWADEGRTVSWSFANHYFRAPLSAILASIDPAEWGTTEALVSLEVPRAAPTGDIVLSGAQIITMTGDEVIENGSVWIRGNRIMEVGPQVSAPQDARVIDVTGKTIMPGLIDTHAHPKTGAEMAPDQEWSIASNLAYGVTTTRNPSGSRWNVAWGELVEAGQMVGSRLYATGFPLTSNNAQITSYEDALHVVRRYKEQGVHSLKQYLQPRRIQRQWILQAAHAEGINVTNEGAADLRMDINMAVDGFTALEHSIGHVPLYKDVVTVLADSKIAYTPTLVVAYGAPAGDGYWRARTDLDKDPKTAFFTPSETLTRQARRRPMIVEEDYNFPLIARGVRDVVRAGGLAGLGSHGQQDGIAAHWELWMLQSGDMTNLEALRIATVIGAEAIGYEQDLGSLEPGKLADLIVLNTNPLDDIQNSTDLHYVMKNGELYEAATLDRLWPSPKPFPKPYWILERERLEGLPGIR